MSAMSVVYSIYRIPVRDTKKEVRNRVRKIKDRALADAVRKYFMVKETTT